MYPWVVGALIGAWAVGRQKPHTPVEKKTSLGPVTGLTYEVDDFPRAGMVVVHGPQRSAAVTFLRTPHGLRPMRSQGDPSVIAAICKDFVRPEPTPSKKAEEKAAG